MAKTDAFGNYEISNVPVGSYQLVIEKRDLVYIKSKNVKVNSGKETEIEDITFDYSEIEKETSGKEGTPGKDGLNGKDGTSVIWKGALSQAPDVPGLLWAYYNTTDGNTYLYDGDNWTLLAASSSDIIWQGCSFCCTSTT